MTDAERSEIERLQGDYAKLHGVVETYINAPGQLKGEAFRDLCGTMEYLAGRDDALGWAGCWQRQKAEIERLRDAVAYLQPRMAVYQGQRMCSPSTWQEFERRVSK